jgi:hypothetical protein
VQLKSRIEQLEVHLLPSIDPTGTYSEKDNDLVRGFCLLSHAEIEAYLEDITIENVTRAYIKWDNNKTDISPIIFHLAYSLRSEKKEPPYSMVVLSYLQLKKTIEKNHGIKEDNINNFFRPIGFQMDETLKTTLNEFGKARGEIAHTSFQTQQPLDPLTEKNSVGQIVLSLKVFDEELSTYEQYGTLPRTPIITQWKKFTFRERLKILFTGKH